MSLLQIVTHPYGDHARSCLTTAFESGFSRCTLPSPGESFSGDPKPGRERQNTPRFGTVQSWTRVVFADSKLLQICRRRSKNTEKVKKSALYSDKNKTGCQFSRKSSFPKLRTIQKQTDCSLVFGQLDSCGRKRARQRVNAL